MSDIGFVIISLAVLAGLLTLIGIPLWNALKPERDPDKILVRQWLQENLEEGTWEEVKWFPARTVQGLHDLNLLHIIEAMEVDKQRFERGELKEDKSAEYQELYNKVSESKPRTFCALKFRTATLNGMAKALRNQTFEIVDGKAKDLKSNDIREVTSPLMRNGQNSSHDGWRYFEDRDYEPFPNEPLDGLEKRFQMALIWKAPEPVIAVTPKREEVVRVIPLNTTPSPESLKPEIPRSIREYLDREVQAKSSEVATLEKRITTFETRLRTAKPSQVSAMEDRVRQAKDELTEIKRKRFTASLPDHPLVGDVGALAVIEIIETVDQETVLARWLPNGKGRLPRIEIAILAIDAVQFKGIESARNVDKIYKVTATKHEPSDLITKLIAADKKTEFVVESADVDEITKWWVEYEKEKRSKK